MKWPTRGQWLLLGASTAAALAIFFSGGGKDQNIAAGKGEHIQKAPPVQAAPREQVAMTDHVELERLHPQKEKSSGNASIANAFKSKSWYVAPPPAPVQIPEPVAPPVPFTYLGRYEDKPPVVVILAKGDRVYTVSEGEVIEGTYRVDHIGDDVVGLIYLPMNVNQSISTHGAPESVPPNTGYADRYRRP